MYNANDVKKLLDVVADDFDVCISIDYGETCLEINSISVNTDTKTVVFINDPTPTF